MLLCAFLVILLQSTDGNESGSIDFRTAEDLLELAAKDEIGEPLLSGDFQLSSDAEDTEISLRILEDPIYNQPYFQGDIIGIPIARLQDGPQSLDEPLQFKDGLYSEMPRKWKKGLIPYVISKAFDSEERLIIAKAFDEYHKLTCINFVPRRDEADYIHILKGDGCSSAVGRTRGLQTVSLGAGCLHLGVVIHELMHAMGFWHEHSRPDRGRFIKIVDSNILPGLSYNFKMLSEGSVNGLDVLYDINSILHYGPYAFARDKSKPTIINLLRGGEMGQRRGLSQRDIEKIHKLYCDELPRPPTIQFPDQCVDSSLHCRFWARIGECQNNEEYMKQNCRKSCGECGDSCSDDSPYCDEWAGLGECKSNPEYMKRFCRKSCVLC